MTYFHNACMPVCFGGAKVIRTVLLQRRVAKKFIGKHGVN